MFTYFTHILLIVFILKQTVDEFYKQNKMYINFVTLKTSKLILTKKFNYYYHYCLLNKIVCR